MSRQIRLLLAGVLVAGAMTVLAPPAQAATVTATLVATRSTSTWDRPSPDPSGITWDAVNRQLLISDGEVDEMPLYRGTNLFVSSLTGQQGAFPGGTSLPWSNEPTGVALNNASRSLFVSDDDKDRIFHVRPGADGQYGTADDGTVTSFSTRGIGNTDPEGIAMDLDATNDGSLLAIDGANKEVWEYGPGPNGVFDGVAPEGDDVATHFDVYRHGARDPEGIEYHPGRDTILVLDGRTQKIYEVNRRGELLNVISIRNASPVKAAGLTLAPASNGSGENLYIVDRGVDNNADPSENDGRFYEMSVVLPPLDAGSSGAATFPVRRGADDAEEQATQTVRGGVLDLVEFRGAPQVVGIRFDLVEVPRGATITRAYVQFQADRARTAAASLTIAGQAADDPPSFTTAAGNISSRPRTAAAVQWDPAPWPTAGARGVDQQTSDLAPVIQEIVNRSGWVSGNALVLIVTGVGVRVAESYNSGAALAPALYVEWAN